MQSSDRLEGLKIKNSNLLWFPWRYTACIEIEGSKVRLGGPRPLEKYMIYVASISHTREYTPRSLDAAKYHISYVLASVPHSHQKARKKDHIYTSASYHSI